MVEGLGTSRANGVTLEGDTAERIINAARNKNSNLNVIGSLGLGITKRLLIVSVLQKVSLLAKFGCLIVRQNYWTNIR